MDPVIKGLSLESPCRPSLGKALLINPERCTNIITLPKEHNQGLVHKLENKRITLKWGSISARMCPAHGSFYHVISAFECVFSWVLDGFWRKTTLYKIINDARQCRHRKTQELFKIPILQEHTIIGYDVTTLAFIDDVTFSHLFSSGLVWTGQVLCGKFCDCAFEEVSSNAWLGQGWCAL